MTVKNAQSDHVGETRLFQRLQSVMPPWGVSLAFHVVLILLLVALAPMTRHNRSAPGGRVTENVGIVFAPTTSGRETSQNPVPATQASATQTSVSDIISDHIRDLTPPQPIVPSVIGSMPSVESPGNRDSGANNQTNAPGSGIADGMLSASFIGVQGTGSKFVYVLDRSASTGYGQRRSPLYVAKTELLASLQSIGETSLRESKPIRFQVIFFNNETAVFNTVGYGGSDQSGRLLRYDQATFNKVQRFLSGIIPDGGTLPEPALMLAVGIGADCVFFMTDGDKPINQAQLQRIRNTAKGVQINVVEYGTGPRSARNNSLQQLAAENHGNYVYVDLSLRPR